MPHAAVFPIVIAAVTIWAAPVLADSRVPGNGGLLPIPDPQRQMQRQIFTAPPSKSPYPMTYTEQVAQSLGLREDGVSLYESREALRNPYTPSVTLGGTMLRLRWRP
jgi:hypothetical protein